VKENIKGIIEATMEGFTGVGGAFGAGYTSPKNG